MSIMENIKKRRIEEMLKAVAQQNSNSVSLTPNPGMGNGDYYTQTVPVNLLSRAYHYESEVSIFADIVQTLVNEILRNGLEWVPLFAAECRVCGHRSNELIDACPACGSTDLRKPDESELKRFNHADGSDFFERANNYEQSLIKIMESLEYHLEVANRGILLVTKAYVSNEKGKIIDAVPLEIQVLHPMYVTPLFDPKLGKMGGHGRVCIRHEQRTLLGDNQYLCPICHHETYEALYRTNMPSGPVGYYVAGEIRFVTKYGPDIFGYPAIIKLADDAWAYHHLEKRTCAYYDNGRPPGIVSIPTNNFDATMSLWDKIIAKCKMFPHYIPWLGFDPAHRAGITFTQLMKDPCPDMLAVKDDIRRRMGSFFGVAPLWQSDTTTSGGLNNETQQLTVSNRAFARGQRIFNEDVLPWLSQQFGIKDWVLKLIPAEDADKLRDEQLVSAKLDNARKALEIGLEVEWLESGYTISGKPQLPEQVNPPISLPEGPDVPVASGAVGKAEDIQAKQLNKGGDACPPGQHRHPGHDYCHPEDRQHRDGSPSDPAADPSAAADISNLVSSLKDLQAELPKSEVKLSETKFTKIDYYDADEFFEPTFTRPITDDEKKVIKSYTESSGMINGVLDSEDIDKFVKDNNLSAADLQTISKEITTIDSAIEDTILHESITVYRGVDGMEMFGTTDYNSLLFKTKIRKAFNSTSINHGVAVDFALSNERVKHPAMLVLRVPAGKGVGMYVREFGGEYGSEEYEFLMKRGTKYIITKITRDGMLPVIEAVVVE